MATSGKSGKVYVANVTAQNHELNFRLPEGRKAISIKIGMGRQAYIGDMSSPEIDAMVDQLGPYGLVELGQEAAREKIAYIFHVGGPVPANAMQKVYERNRGILRDEGAERRQLAAVAANNAMNTDDTPLKNMEMSVEEVDSGGLGNESDNVREGVKIDNESDTSENKRPRSKKKYV